MQLRCRSRSAHVLRRFEKTPQWRLHVAIVSAMIRYRFFALVRPGDRRVSCPLTEAEKNAATIPPSKTIADHILANAQDSLPVVQDFVRLAESNRTASASDKIVGWPVLLELRARARASGKTVVWTNGCFDLIHVGHVRNLQAARSLGDLLVVGVNSDASVSRLKGAGRPIIPAAERVEILAAFACVDYLIVFEEDTPLEAIRQSQPDIHCKGADYAPPNGKPIPEAAIVESYGGRIEFLPMLPGASTSDLIGRIQKAQSADGNGET
jgi:rfaE bifunctional protein nucleotidyltransferase chain/domain